MPSGDLASLRGLAECQAGVVSRSQAREAGFSDFAIRARITSGAWERLGRALVLRDVTQAGDLRMAWLLAFNTSIDSVITGPLAVRLGGWNLSGRELIVVDEHHRPAGLPNVHLMRRASARMVPRRDGLRIAPRRDALVDTLVCTPLRRAEDVLDVALQRRWLHASDLKEIVSQRSGPGRKGVSRLRHLQQRASSGSRSEAEHQMRLLLRRTRGMWVANYAIRGSDGTIVAEIDFADPHLRIAIEVDGRAFHSDHRSFERDRQRQNMLVLQGWIILRFTWERIVHDPQSVIAEVDAAIEHAKSRIIG